MVSKATKKRRYEPVPVSFIIHGLISFMISILFIVIFKESISGELVVLIYLGMWIILNQMELMENNG